MMNSSITPMIVPAVLWTLIAFSVVTWAVLLIKGLQFARNRTENKRFRKAFWEARSLEEGESVAEQRPGTMASIARAGFAVITGSDISPDNRELAQRINRSDRLERSLRQQIQRERRSLEGGLAILASIGSTSPFIGLFGTVWGIMEALVTIGETGEAGLDTVAGPIGHALIATGVGIAVAVPAVLVYNYFTRRLKLNVSLMDDFAHDFYSLAQQNEFHVRSSVDTGHAAHGNPAPRHQPMGA
ncbi:outer membrane transport energization protein ExbB [Kushneria sinocarnis]|uniref:Outer membrane transport energization protein ExbB n=1 Tax=Kushneria sinocarnis TaxID=595502 RepID=A0A420WXK9_9GAMM|nr:MotA/TolQ/ExbB proton channel family protein [Kushneria sinocarnis]RKR04501.1 outer membrane transport energization protein ExbB [Kushneria sinocarnis]